MIENVKTIEIPNTPYHLLHITDVKIDNKLTVVYNGYGGAHWAVIDYVSLDDKEKLLEAAYRIQKQIKGKL